MDKELSALQKKKKRKKEDVSFFELSIKVQGYTRWMCIVLIL